MKRQNIQFKGLRHTPSDITGQDGDLLECVNLIHENGELKPIEMPEKTYLKGVYSNETLVAVHNLTDGKKFVFAVWNTATTIIHIKDANNTVVFTRGIPREEILWAETIGNTLIIGTDKSTHYAFYKNGAYKWLGDKLPQPVFEFDLSSNSDTECLYHNVYEPNPYCEDGDGNYAPGGGIQLKVNQDLVVSSNDERYSELFFPTDENKRIIRDNLRSKMAELIKTAKQECRFVYPFLIRYAVRLYDGSYAMHSAPILMLPSTDKCPILATIGLITLGSNEGNNYVYTVGNLALKFKSKPLKLKFKGFYTDSGTDITSSIDEWEDIVKGVDLFLSSQIVTYNDRYFDNLDNIPTRYYNRPPQHPLPGVEYIPDYGFEYSNNAKKLWINNHVSNSFDINETIGDLFAYYKNQYFNLPSHSNEWVMEQIGETHLFYRAKKFDINKLTDSDFLNHELYLHNLVEFGSLENLETLPVLHDDYVSRCRITGKVNYNYNQRLLLGNIKLQAPLWYQDAKVYNKGIDLERVQMCFVIEKPEKTIYVRWDFNDPSVGYLGSYDFGHFIYYPDPDCKKLIVSINATVSGGNSQGSTYTIKTVTIPMHEHTGLNGAYALMPDLMSLAEAGPEFDVYDDAIPDQSSDRYYQQPNTIAMSSVANPFHFPASNFKDIGRTKVVGIAANTLDVSSGQWGQYPLYVFCSDGIIAIIIDGEGKFGGIQAVSADVLREPRGLSQPTLVQAGQALMFLTQRGVMAIGGTQIKCLSEAMDGRHFNAMRELADVDYHVGAFANLIGRTSDDTDFRDFAASGFLAFDYAHNRVLMLRSDRDYQYVYSLNTGFWSKQIIYTNLDSFQVEVVPGNELPAQRSSGVPLLKVKPIRAAVNNYTEMYLQDEDGWLYKTMEVQGQNSVKQLYQYGYIVSRPIRFGTDEYKTVVKALHRFNHYAKKSFVRLAMYGSRDGVKYGRINSLGGMSYQYFIFVIYTYLKPNERYSYLSVDFETRLTNKLR